MAWTNQSHRELMISFFRSVWMWGDSVSANHKKAATQQIVKKHKNILFSLDSCTCNLCLSNRTHFNFWRCWGFLALEMFVQRQNKRHGKVELFLPGEYFFIKFKEIVKVWNYKKEQSEGIYESVTSLLSH